MTRIILVRHGKSVANAKNIFAGHFDAELHDDGAVQAKLTADFIKKNYKVDRVYASDLKRAFRTGQIIADTLGLDVISDSGFREIGAGEWDGKLFEDLPKLYPDDFVMWKTDIGNSRCTGGETVRGLSERIMATLTRVASDNDGKTLVVASHATPIRSIATIILHGDVSLMQEVRWPTNASVTEVTFDEGKWALVKYSQDAHLESLITKLPKNI